MKKALVLGDDKNASYHPLAPVLPLLMETLEGFALDATDAYATEPLALGGYDLIIAYPDTWPSAYPKDLVAGILRFVAGGGGLLAIHNGISLHGSPELAQLLGGRFTHHPPQGMLRFEPCADHPITLGVSGFALDDEPYRFEPATLASCTVLMRYEHEGAMWDAAWCREYGAGRVAYLAPGHGPKSFMDPMYRRMILNAAVWITDGQEGSVAP